MDIGCEDSKHADEPVKIVELEKRDMRMRRGAVNSENWDALTFS